MTKRILLQSEAEVTGALIGFRTAIDPSDFNKLQLEVCEKLIRGFMKEGVEFHYTANVEKETATFNASRRDNQPRITIFYETSSLLRCFWIFDGAEENHTFSITEINSSDEAIRRVIEDWKAAIRT